MLNQDNELTVHHDGNVIVKILVKDLLYVGSLQGGGFHLQVGTVEGVVQRKEAFLPVSVFGKIVHKEGILVGAVLGGFIF